MTQVTADFELGTNGNNVETTDAGSATAWDTISRAGASTIKYSNAQSYGTLSAEFFSGAGSSHWVEWNTSLGTVVNHFGRVYIWRDVLSSGSTHYWASVLTTGGTLLCGRYAIDTAGKILLQPNAGGTTTGTVTVALGQWVRLEYKMVNSVTVGLMEVQLFNSPDSSTPSETITSAADKNTRADTDTLRFGSEQPADASYTHRLDNIVAGATSYPGPIVQPGGLGDNPPMGILGRGAGW